MKGYYVDIVRKGYTHRPFTNPFIGQCLNKEAPIPPFVIKEHREVATIIADAIKEVEKKGYTVELITCVFSKNEEQKCIDLRKG